MVSTLLVAVLFQAAPAPAARVLHLSEAVDAGLANQPSIRQARAQTKVLTERASEAKAPMLPQITGVASYQRVRGSALGSRGAVTGATPTVTTSTSASGIDVFTVGANASQLIWDFNQTYDKYRSADRLASSAEAQEQTTSYLVVAGVRRAYFTARAQRALVKVAQDSLANLDRHLGQIQGFVQVGTRPEIDLAQAKTDLANGRVALVNAENAYALAKAQLAQSIGDASSADFEVTDDEIGAVDGEELPADALVAKAIAARPELVALKRQRESNELAIRGLEGGYGPSLSATAAYAETGTSLDALGPAWNVGVALTWPLFQGGVTRAQVREAEATMSVTDAQLDAEKLQIRVDVQQAALALRAAKATESAADDALANAQAQLKLAEGRYESGVGSGIELGDAQNAVTNASAQVVTARFRLSSARSDLLAAMGKR